MKQHIFRGDVFQIYHQGHFRALSKGDEFNVTLRCAPLTRLPICFILITAIQDLWFIARGRRSPIKKYNVAHIPIGVPLNAAAMM